jgi:hypothetical protein
MNVPARGGAKFTSNVLPGSTGRHDLSRLATPSGHAVVEALELDAMPVEWRNGSPIPFDTPMTIGSFFVRMMAGLGLAAASNGVGQALAHSPARIHILSSRRKRLATHAQCSDMRRRTRVSRSGAAVSSPGCTVMPNTSPAIARVGIVFGVRVFFRRGWLRRRRAGGRSRGARMWQWKSQLPTRSGTHRIIIVLPGASNSVVTSLRLGAP